MTSKFYKFLNKGHERTVRAKKNILASFFLKGINIGSGLLIVPLAIEYLDPTRYGVWLTINSVVMWFGFMDVGLGHGLRNKFAEAMAQKNKTLAKKYVSTGYLTIAAIAVGFFLLFAIANQFLNWSKLLNAPEIPKDELKTLTFIVFGFFSMRLVLKLIGNILLADQKPALKDLAETSGKVLNLLIIFLLVKTTKGSLLYLGMSYSIAPVVMLSVFSLIFFHSSYKEIAPKYSFFDSTLVKNLLNLGGKFFVIQIAVVVLYTTDNMIISHLFSPAEVTPYQIAHRYFGLVLMGTTIVVTPFWSAVTEAYTTGEIDWIKKSIKKLIKFWGIILSILLIMLLLSDQIYQIWLGNKVTIPFILSLSWAIFIGVQVLGSLFTQFINGIGKMKLSLYTATANMLINIPLSIFFAKYLNFGVVGVLCATFISVFFTTILRIIQFNKIINNKATGIWSK